MLRRHGWPVPLNDLLPAISRTQFERVGRERCVPVQSLYALDPVFRGAEKPPAIVYELPPTVPRDVIGRMIRVGNVWSSRFMRHFTKRQRTDKTSQRGWPTVLTVAM